MSQKKYRHINEAERLKIYKLLFEGHSLQTIANHLGRHKSTIYREFSRNSTKVVYRPDFASQQYLLRRLYQLSKIDRNGEVKRSLQAFGIKAEDQSI